MSSLPFQPTPLVVHLFLWSGACPWGGLCRPLWRGPASVVPPPPPHSPLVWLWKKYLSGGASKRTGILRPGRVARLAYGMPWATGVGHWRGHTHTERDTAPSFDITPPGPFPSFNVRPWVASARTGQRTEAHPLTFPHTIHAHSPQTHGRTDDGPWRPVRSLAAPLPPPVEAPGQESKQGDTKLGT